MTDPLQAIVDDATDTVIGVVVMDQATVDLFRQYDWLTMLWPGCTLYDVTNPPRPGGPGWTHHPGTATEWRPPQPSPDATWDDDTGTWQVPETAPVDEPIPG